MRIKLFVWFSMLLATLFFSPVARAIPIVGSSSGIFINPIGPAGMLTTGVGTNSFAWGDGAPFLSPSSSLGFAGTSFSTNTETEFKIGDLTYFNGTIVAGTQADSVDMQVSLAFTTPSGLNTNLVFNMLLVNTPNTGDPVASADSVFLPSPFPSSTFSLGGIEHTLSIAFGETTSGGFIETDQFFVFEGSTATGELRGIITADLPPELRPVPVPSTMLLLGSGLAGLGFFRRRRKAA